eukprot:TRINITY_DN49495_c0_g1_i1.p1 TRINITY_DN49495_c0_g1~~TRINITY_DN49495_c0_g1_i1.p1  ORF type:complete len:222 (+),score=50.19 TRINITY_DN49495_c0_g1_i1:70-666(+)
MAPPANAAFWLLDKVFGASPEMGRQLRAAAWREMESLQVEKICRYIGVSNYDKGLLEELEAYATVLPAVNQIEAHPRFHARATEQHCKSRGIASFAYGNGVALDAPELHKVASGSASSLTAAQISLAWTLQQGFGVVVRSSRRQGMRENLAAASVALPPEEAAAIASLGESRPFYWDMSVVSRIQSSKASAPEGQSEL